MLTITPLALEKVKELITEQDEEGASLRIMIAGMGCGGPQYTMSLDKDIAEEDITVQNDGLTMVVDPESAPMLEGSEIDYIETLERSGFTVNNPNFQGGGGGGGGCGGNCSCGKGN
ncbi:MAG: iron-sulfur cluster assembly accessory protein [Chloroflexi bacterium]|nr:iron-sulfur cluster assembly accessory protein [Chloroflexota bacterium]